MLVAVLVTLVVTFHLLFGEGDLVDVAITQVTAKALEGIDAQRRILVEVEGEEGDAVGFALFRQVLLQQRCDLIDDDDKFHVIIQILVR